MKYPLMKLTECILKYKKTFAKGVVTRKMQEDLAATIELNCSTQLEYITTERYDCQCLHETSYHYSIKIGDNGSVIIFSVAALRDGEKTIETKLLFKDLLQASWMKLVGAVEKEDYLR